MDRLLLGDNPAALSAEAPPYLAVYGSAAPFWVAGASVLGQRHAHHGLPRDDALVLRAAGGRLVAVVADGVGSAPLARAGAACASSALAAALTSGPRGPSPGPAAAARPGRRWRAWLRRLRRRGGHRLAPPPTAFEAPNQAAGGSGTLAWWPAVMSSPSEECVPPADLAGAVHGAFREARAALCARAAEAGRDPGDLATTGLVIVVQGALVAAGQLGDGALLGLTRTGALHLLVPLPERPDPRVTRALSDDDWEAHLEVHVWDRPGDDPFDVLLPATDGVANDVLAAGLPAARDWALALAATLRAAGSPEQAAARLAGWLAAYRVRGSWDDRTLAAIMREGNQGGRDSRGH